MRYYLDTEFDGHGGALLSLALVREDGASIHIRTMTRATDPWVIQNVELLMHRHQADVSGMVWPNEVGGAIRKHIGEDPTPVIIADSPVDIGRFCAALSTGADGGWASADYPRMTFEVHNVDCYPTTLPDAVQHNAWWDAMALRHLLQSSEAQPECSERSSDPTLSGTDNKTSDGWMQEVVDGFEKLIEFVEREELHDEGAFDVECEVCLALEAARKTLLRLRGAS